MLLLRKILFYIFFLIYLIFCPLIVARMLGFIVNPMTHRLVKTGLVYVSTNPPDATVYIDGRMARQSTPTVIRDLTPGEHFIRIELSGYNDWERNIPIVGKKATILANTLLIPEEWPIKTISNRPYRNITAADDNILIAANPALEDIDVYDTLQGTEKSLFSQNSVYASGHLVRLFNAPPSPFVLLEALIKDKNKFLWVNLRENPPVIEDISDLLTEIPTRIAWDGSDNENIYVFYPASRIYRISINDKTISPQDPDLLPESVAKQPANRLQEEFLINDKNDLITRERSWIRLYTREDYNTPEVYTIARSRPSTNMYFEEKNGELFYVDDATGFLSTVQILPYRPVLNIPIPEALMIKISKKEPDL